MEKQMQKTRYKSNRLVINIPNYMENNFLDSQYQYKVDVHSLLKRLSELIDNYDVDKEPDSIKDFWNNIEIVKNIEKYNEEVYNSININYFNYILKHILTKENIKLDFQSIILLLFNAHSKLFSKEYLEPFKLDIMYKRNSNSNLIENKIIIKDGVLTLIDNIDSDISYHYNYIIDKDDRIVLSNSVLRTYNNYKYTYSLMKLYNKQINIPSWDYRPYSEDYNKNILFYKLAIYNNQSTSLLSVLDTINLKVDLNINELEITKQHFSITLNRYNLTKNISDIIELVLSRNKFDDFETILGKRKLLEDKESLGNKYKEQGFPQDQLEAKYIQMFQDYECDYLSFETHLIDFMNIFISMADNIVEDDEQQASNNSNIETNWS